MTESLLTSSHLSWARGLRAPLAGLLVLGLAACATGEGTGDAEGAPESQAPATQAPEREGPAEGQQPRSDGMFENSCDAEAASFAIGEPFSQGLAIDAMRAAGAQTLRSLGPDQAATMEYRGDRLNLILDDEDRVVELRCG